jgi:hypothetical protein
MISSELITARHLARRAIIYIWSASTRIAGALTHDFCYPSDAVASCILLPIGWADGSTTWRGKSAWQHVKS